jgi:hypothetical protein
MFTGKVTAAEIQHERPAEWERMQADPERMEEIKVR